MGGSASDGTDDNPVSRETAGITDPCTQSLGRYARLVFAENARTNLVSRRLSQADVTELVQAHARLLVAAEHPGAAFPNGLSGVRLLDIGSGAGLPGIPLRIRHPELTTVLAESRKLRVQCLRKFVEELGLDHTTVVEGNVSSALPASPADVMFDIVTAFGVGKAVDVISVVRPFLANGGRAYISIPSKPEETDVARWHLEAAFHTMRADPLMGILPGPRSVLRLMSAG